MLKTYLSNFEVHQKEFYQLIMQVKNEFSERIYLMDNSISDLNNDFDEIYQEIFHEGQKVRLNNFYKYDFFDFNNNFVIFKKEQEEGFFSTQLTRSVQFDLRLPRLY